MGLVSGRLLRGGPERDRRSQGQGQPHGCRSIRKQGAEHEERRRRGCGEPYGREHQRHGWMRPESLYSPDREEGEVPVYRQEVVTTLKAAGPTVTAGEAPEDLLALPEVPDRRRQPVKPLQLRVQYPCEG